jgi:diadenosine tetraphosphate (Ap4A) HIT family hydrolase
VTADPGQACIFCAIVAGEAPASTIAVGPGLTAFMDIRPVAAGHLLIAPNRHAESLAELTDEEGAAMFNAAAGLAERLRASGIPCDGVNLFLADGEAAGQEVFHVHLHVIPRSAGDGFKVDADAWRRTPPTRAELDDQARRIG